MDFRDLNDGYPLPFVKQGIISAIDFLPNNHVVVYIDATGNPGFSGGPIITLNRTTNQPRVVAVVSNYPTAQEDKVLRKVIKSPDKHTKDKIAKPSFVETDMVVKSNPGLVVAHSINSALDIISKRSNWSTA